MERSTSRPTRYSCGVPLACTRMSRRRDGEGVSPRLRVRRSLWARSVDASVRNSVDSRSGSGAGWMRYGNGVPFSVRKRALHFACGTIHDELRLGQIEIKAPPRLTPFEQKMRQRFGVL